MKFSIKPVVTSSTKSYLDARAVAKTSMYTEEANALRIFVHPVANCLHQKPFPSS